jgi:hypothetical protein
VVYRDLMWSRSLHVTVGRYPAGTWHVAVVETEYRKGIPRDRELLVDVVADEDQVQRMVAAATRAMMRRELEDRLTETAAAEPVPLDGRAPARR